MLITITQGNHTEYLESCICHKSKASGLGVCGHSKFTGTQKELICQYTNTPTEHHNPPSLCPMITEPIEGVRVEMCK